MDINALTDELVRDEGLRLKPYRDSVRSEAHPEGILTIGVGRNLEDVGITEVEARYLLASDIGRVVRDLDAHCPWWHDLDEVRQRVLANMCFNMGVQRLLGFRMFLAACRAGLWESAAAEMLASKWAAQVRPRAKRLSDTMRSGK